MKTNLFTRIWRKLNKTISSFFFIDQWVILFAHHANYKSLAFNQFQKITPAPDRYWADPFVIERNGRYYIFIEEKIYKTGKGHIACLTTDKAGALLSNQIVLEKPYHLSYPFVFEHDSQLYMLPESAGNRSIELYRSVNFPHEWHFVKNLMTNIYATDATLLEHDGKWWLFTNVKADGGSSLDSLYLYYSDSPLADHWVAHPKNPIVKDIKSARPAGKIFKDGKMLIRPSQDNSRRYGYALNFNEITKLNTLDYEEKTITQFSPPAHTSTLAIHTWNEAASFKVSDAVIRRKKQKQ